MKLDLRFKSKDSLMLRHLCEVKYTHNIQFLFRQNGKYRGLSSKCTHYGAPLIKGKGYSMFLSK